jgi:hypothetical protein
MSEPRSKGAAQLELTSRGQDQYGYTRIQAHIEAYPIKSEGVFVFHTEKQYYFSHERLSKEPSYARPRFAKTDG